MEHERTATWAGATPAGQGGAEAAGAAGLPVPRRLHLIAPVEEDAGRPDARPPEGGTDDPILTRLDELARLLLRRDAGAGPAAPQSMDAAGASIARRQDAEVTSLREAMAARVAGVEAAAARALAEAEDRLDGALALQAQLIEGLMAEKERTDAALRLLQDAISAQVAEGAALAAGLDERLVRLEEAPRGDHLLEGLGACARRLDDVLLHLEGDAVDRLPGGGRPLKAALRLLADQIAAVRADLSALAGTGPEAGAGGPDVAALLAEPEDDSIRLVLAEAAGEAGAA